MTISAQQGIDIRSGEDVGSATYVYTDGDLSGAEDGWYNAKYDSIIVQVGVATLTASSMTYRIEGREKGSGNRPANILTASLNATSLIDTFVEVSEHVGQIRVGLLIDNTSTPNNVYTKLIMTDVK